MTQPLRVRAVSFLNAHPLYLPLVEQPPTHEDGLPLFEVQTALPSACADQLAAGDCDLALVPVAAYARHPEWEVVPDIAIACRGAVQTVVVVSEVPLEHVRRIHMDEASRTSAILLQILLRARGLEPTLVPAAHGTGAAAARGTDGALIIGDAAFGIGREFPHVLDLGAEWFTHTGLPMVFAFWAARPGALEHVHVQALQAARDRGLRNAEAYARAYRDSRLQAGLDAADENFYANYLRRSIRHDLDAYERQGLIEFLTRAREASLVPQPETSEDEDDGMHVRFASHGYARVEAARRRAPARGPMRCEPLLEHAAAGGRLDLAEGMFLYENADTMALGDAADRRRHALHPEGVVTYIIDRNVNYTNVCTARCKFCNFYVPPEGVKSKGGYVLDREELARKFSETEALGGVQILLQGGLNPALDLAWYEDFFRWTKQNFRLRLHALSPTEIIHIAHLEDLSVREVLERLRAAGMDSLPGGGAEILHDEIRNRISPFKNTTQEWLDVMRVAHELGMKTTATMVFGFQETAEHVFVHFDRLREVQDAALERGGPGRFTAFITWPFQADGTRLKLRDDTSAWRYLRIQALARLYLDNIPNIQVSWPTLGPEVGEVGLRFGANDFGSVMIEENVVSQAGAHFMLTSEQIEHHIRQAGFTPARRNMEYRLLETPAA
jgi:cyclic dehypoxanthinyl futalosine synthase